MAEKPVLGYWRTRGRADPIRLLLKHLEVDFEDRRYGDAEDLPTWSEEKDNLGMSFPNLPYWKDGDIAHSESIPILRSICRKYKPEYMGRNEAEAGRADAYTPNLNAFLMDIAFKYLWPEDYASKMEEGKAAMAQWLVDFVNVMDGNAFIAGNEGPTYADFQIHFAFTIIENYDAATLAANAKATEYRERFRALPNVAAAIEAQSKEQLFPARGWQLDNMPQELSH